MFPLMIGAAFGGAAMYLFDPEQGRRRRARLRDQAAKAQSDVRDLVDSGTRDLSNRATAITGRMRSKLFRKAAANDRVLAERVRSKMGRYVAHPSAVEVEARDGTVTLSGYVLAHEHSDFVYAVGDVPGVKSVVDRLSVFERAEGISEPQGGGQRRGQRMELMQDNWAPGPRLIAGAAGATLVLLALRGGLRGWLYAGAGALLLARTAVNKPLRTLAGRSGSGVVDIEKTIYINASPQQVFDYLANYENFPQFMRNVYSVTTKPDGRSHWVVAGPAGTRIEFESYLLDLVPNELISWASVEGSTVDQAGTIRLQPADQGTRVHLMMSYAPPAGVLGHAVARLFGADPKSELDEDLMRLKNTLETGKAPRDAAAQQREHAAEQNTAQPA